MTRKTAGHAHARTLALVVGGALAAAASLAPGEARAQWYYSSSGRVGTVETENHSFSRNLRVGVGVNFLFAPVWVFGVDARVIFDIAPVAELTLRYSYPALALDTSNDRGLMSGEAGVYLHSNTPVMENANYTLQQSSYSDGYYRYSSRTSVNTPMMARSTIGARIGGLYYWGTHAEKPDEASPEYRYAPMRVGGYVGFGWARYFNSASYIAGWGQRGTTGFVRIFADGVFTPVISQGDAAGLPPNPPVWGYGARVGAEGSVGRSIEAGYRAELGWNRIGGWYLTLGISMDFLFTFDQ